MKTMDVSPDRRLVARLSPAPVWISHRGVRSSGATENTAAAFDCAIAKKFQWLETDLRVTQDGHIVLSHDENLDRVTGLKPRRISPLDLKHLTRSVISDINLPCGGKILFLDTFMNQFCNVKWVFDIKTPTAQECLKKLRIMVDQMQNPSEIEHKITLLLWTDDDERVAKELFPAVRFFARTSECWRAGVLSYFGIASLAGIKEGRAYSITAKLGIFSFVSLFTRRVFNEYQSRGAKVILYLTKNEGDLAKGLEAGADFILSDELILDSANGK